MHIFSTNQYKTILDQSKFDSITGKEEISPKKTIVWQGHCYEVISQKTHSYNGFQLICRRIFAIFFIAISLGTLLFFESSKKWISHFWHDKKIYLLVKNSNNQVLHKNLEFLTSCESKTSKITELNVYPVCNETNLETVYQELKQTKNLKGKRVHVGCAGWYNFDIIALRQSHYGIIFDINKDSIDFMKTTIALLKHEKTKADFERAILEYMLAKQTQKPNTFFCKYDFDKQKEIPLREIIQHEKSREGSWLYSEQSYNHIKALAVKGKLGVIQQDVENSTAFKITKQKLMEHRISVDTVYLSNIANFINEKSKAFVDTVTTLLDDESTLISSPLLVERSNPKIQRKDKYGKSRIHQITLKGSQIKAKPELLFTNPEV